MVRSVSEGFTEFLSRLTPTTSERQAAARHRGSVESTIKANFGAIRFYQAGSFRHGTGVRRHADIDLLAWLPYTTQPADSWSALSNMERVLSSTFWATEVRISRPAVVVDFASGAERWEVIPGYTTGKDGIFEIPSPESGGGWIETAPDAHFEFVNTANDRGGVAGGAKSLARLLKAWKYYNAVPISSFYLELSAARYMNTQSSFVPIFDLAFVFDRLYDSGLASFADPSNTGGRIEATSSTTNLTKAKEMVLTATARSTLAMEAHVANRTDDAFTYLRMLYDNKFPSR